MNGIKLFFKILCSFLIFSSCSNNDDSNSDSIIGNWIVIESKLDGNDLDLADFVKFTSDNRTEFTYKRKNGDLIMRGDWIKINNILTITWDELPPGYEPAEFVISELTHSTMKWKIGMTEETLKR